MTPSLARSVDYPEVAPQINYTPYNDGTNGSATHEYVKIEKAEPVEEPREEYNSYDDFYDSYDGYEESYDYSDDYSYDSGSGDQLSYSNGVNYYGGHRETWYSSNESGGSATAVPVPGLWCDDNGIYRDADGYVVVASDDRGYGSTVDTSWGEGKVYDNFGGSSSGTDAVDIYTSW